jgi:tetratricopeptide (TPR) repeat protein
LHTLKKLPALTLLLIATGCTGLQTGHVTPEQDIDCPDSSATEIIDQQNQLSRFSSTPTLYCALTAVRNNLYPTQRRTTLGSRLCLYLAERETDQNKREQLAAEGVGFAEIALAQGGEDDGALHYYLATNLGLAIREHIVLAMDNLGRLESEMQHAVALNPDEDGGGPLRILGMLYLKAPAWPKGIGDHDKAMELLEKAVKTHPEHPLNHLFYAEALWDDENASLQKQAKTEFALGKHLLDASDWGYSKKTWQQEFAAFSQECKSSGCNLE